MGGKGGHRPSKRARQGAGRRLSPPTSSSWSCRAASKAATLKGVTATCSAAPAPAAAASSPPAAPVESPSASQRTSARPPLSPAGRQAGKGSDCWCGKAAGPQPQQLDVSRQLLAGRASSPQAGLRVWQAEHQRRLTWEDVRHVQLGHAVHAVAAQCSPRLPVCGAVWR